MDYARFLPCSCIQMYPFRERRVRLTAPMNTPTYTSTPLNPGIVKTVEFLRTNGFITMDSGDGETHAFECDQPYPYVHMRCAPIEMVPELHRRQCERLNLEWVA